MAWFVIVLVCKYSASRPMTFYVNSFLVNTPLRGRCHLMLIYHVGKYSAPRSNIGKYSASRSMTCYVVVLGKYSASRSMTVDSNFFLVNITLRGRWHLMFISVLVNTPLRGRWHVMLLSLFVIIQLRGRWHSILVSFPSPFWLKPFWLKPFCLKLSRPGSFSLN